LHAPHETAGLSCAHQRLAAVLAQDRLGRRMRDSAYAVAAMVMAGLPSGAAISSISATPRQRRLRCVVATSASLRSRSGPAAGASQSRKPGQRPLLRRRRAMSRWLGGSCGVSECELLRLRRGGSRATPLGGDAPRHLAVSLANLDSDGSFPIALRRPGCAAAMRV